MAKTSFSASIGKFHLKTMEKYIAVKRGAIVDLSTSIILQTPVDTGLLRGNWRLSLNKTSKTKHKSKDKSGQATIARIVQKSLRVGLNTTAYLVNNLPYTIPIEYNGHSAKAPKGVVRVNLARWDDIVRANVRKFK